MENVICFNNFNVKLTQLQKIHKSFKELIEHIFTEKRIYPIEFCDKTDLSQSTFKNIRKRYYSKI